MVGDKDFMFGLITAIYFWMVICIVCISYWIFFIPLNITKDLTDVTYDFVTKNINRKDIKKDTINRVRRLRKLGKNSSLIPPPYPNGWYAIIESEKVKIRQAVHVACLGEHFVVFRAENNEIHVLDAYCPHMGANLGIGGIVDKDCIKCPFHLWSFRGSDGQCVDIPYSTSGNIPKNAKVKKWISQEVNDSVFIWYHAENQEPWKLSQIKEIQTNELSYIGRNEYLVNCHIQEIPENGADLAHFAAVHRDSVLRGSKQNTNSWSASIGEHVWDASWQASSDPHNLHKSIVNLKHCVKLFDKIKIYQINVQGIQIGPSYVELHTKSFYGPVIIVQTVTPIEPMLQKVIHRFYGSRYAAIFVKLLVWGESVMFERDMNVWNHKMYENLPMLVKEDRALKSFRNWYSQFYSENSKTFLQAKETLEW